MNMQCRRYVELMRTVYYIANSPSSSSAISTALLHVLFTNLKDDALAFLAGIWSGAERRARDNEHLRALALLHASAFLQAHIDEDDGVDFQTIVPLLLIGLSSPSGLVRQAAIKCVAQLQVLAERQLVTVYKFDGIYGVKESKLMDCCLTVRR
jgi:U3 small nucleolar RNA-associated protein 10